MPYYVQTYRAFLRIIKSGDQFNDSTFPTATFSDKSDTFTMRNFQTEIF
jgi:hypothetical protein